MPAAATVEIVMLGIQAAMRINAQYRRAYADSTRSLAITLPVPAFTAAVNQATIENFYLAGPGRQFRAQNAKLDAIIRKINNSGSGSLTEDEKAELTSLYKGHNQMLAAANGTLLTDGSANPAGLTNEDLKALFTIRQWRAGDGPPTMLRQMAGVLINVAADFLVNMPGVISTTSNQGKALRGFLEAIDQIDLADASGKTIVETLFLGAVQTIRDHPEVLTPEQKVQELFRNVGGTLYTNSKRWFDNAAGDLAGQERILSWSQMVLASVLSSAGDVVFAQPAKYFGITDEGQAALITGVADAVLDSVLDRDHPEHLELGALLTRSSLDKVVKAALQAVGDHPDLLKIDNQAVHNIIQGTARALAASALVIGPDIVPEAIRLVLENTGKNFGLLVDGGAPGAPRNLLVSAIAQVLEQLAVPPPNNARWKLKFDATDARHIIESAVDEVVQNPAWLTTQAGAASPLLGNVVKAVLDTLRTIAPDNRLSRQTAIAIITAAVNAAGRRIEFLQIVNGEMLISSFVKAVLATAFNQPEAAAGWVLARNEVLQSMVEIVLQVAVRYGASPDNLAQLQALLKAEVAQLKAGESWSLDDFASNLEAALGPARLAMGQGGGQV